MSHFRPWSIVPYLRRPFIPRGAGPTAFTKSFTGTLTPAGTTVVKKVSVADAGTLTPAATLTRQAGVKRAASLSPAGALAKQDKATRAASLSLVGGTVGRKASKFLAFAASLTPAPVLARRAVLGSFAASITPAGSSLIRATTKARTGSITLSGAATRLSQYNRPFSASLTPSSVLAKKDTKATFTGSITPSGVLIAATIGLISRSFSGSLSLGSSPLTFTYTWGRILSGTLTPTVTLKRAVAQNRAGTITPTGVRLGKMIRPLAGIITPAGSLGRVPTRYRSFSGQISLGIPFVSGGVGGLNDFPVNGVVINGVGGGGSVGTANLLGRRTFKGLTQPLVLGGVLTGGETFALALSGILTPVGSPLEFRFVKLKGFTATLAPSAALIRATAIQRSGSLLLDGDRGETGQFHLDLAGELTLDDLLLRRFIGPGAGIRSRRSWLGARIGARTPE